MFGSRFFEGDALVDLAEEHVVVVVAVEYRLAPENPYPAGLDDCLASLDWLVQNASLLGVGPKRILVGGRSAGGHLAAAMALRTRDEARRCLAGQLLVYPMLDNRTSAEPGSVIPNVSIWNHVSNNTAWQAYLGGAEGIPYDVPARAQIVADLAPAYIDIGSADLFRDECAVYAARIWAAGGSAELHIWEGANHGFDLAAGTVISSAAFAARASWFQRDSGPESQFDTGEQWQPPGRRALLAVVPPACC